MSRICQTCGKGSVMVTPRKLLRGNWNPTAKQRKFPNLQTKKIDGKRVKLCTRCLKTHKKEEAKTA